MVVPVFTVANNVIIKHSQDKNKTQRSIYVLMLGSHLLRVVTLV